MRNIDNMRKQSKINKYILVYLLLAFIPRFVLTQFMWPINIPLDESSTLALPAYLAGYDWSYLMGKTRYYYGYGMAVLFTPIFYLIKNPVLLYRAILVMCAALQTIPGIIAFYILGKFFNQKNQHVKLLLALIASYCVSSTITTVANEHMIYICAWMLGWLLLELINCKNYRKKCIYTCNLMIVAFYALTCHERCKVFIIAIICIVILYSLLEKKLLVSMPTFLLMVSFGYKVTFLLTTKVKSIIWPAGNSAVGLANTSTTVPLKLLKNRELWHVWYNIILGQLGTGTIVTGGILVITIIFGIYMLTRKISLIHSKNGDIENNYFYVVLFGLMTIGAIIFAQSLTWLEKANNAILDSTTSEGGRAFTYIRYYFPCVSMVVVLFLNWLISNCKEKCAKQIMTVAFGVCVFLQMNFVLGIIPLIERTPILNYIHNVYWLFSFLKDGDWTSKYTFLPACVICVIFFGIFIILFSKGRSRVALCLLLVLLGYQYAMKGMALDIPRSATNYHEVRNTLDVIEKMDSEGMLPDYVGITGERIASTNQPTRFLYQYFLQDHRVSYYEPVTDVNEAIYITVSPKVPFKGIAEDKSMWFVIELTENQHIFFKGDRLKEYFKENGYDYFSIEKD